VTRCVAESRIELVVASDYDPIRLDHATGLASLASFLPSLCLNIIILCPSLSVIKYTRSESAQEVYKEPLLQLAAHPYCSFSGPTLASSLRADCRSPGRGNRVKFSNLHFGIVGHASQSGS